VDRKLGVTKVALAVGEDEVAGQLLYFGKVAGLSQFLGRILVCEQARTSVTKMHFLPTQRILALCTQNPATIKTNMMHALLAHFSQFCPPLSLSEAVSLLT
jgi:hypothetical protein